MASEGFHEPLELLRQMTVERHRATASLMEELDAIDWYDQRVDATQDPDLRKILIHNRDDEKEHASMALEWLRRHDPTFEHQLREWLFTDREFITTEAAPEEEAGAPPDTEGSLGIGSLYGEATL
jgi:hypothetical protein